MDPFKPYEPPGVRFYDLASRRHMLLVAEGTHAGWLCWRHPDGQWVTLRKATDADRAAIDNARHPSPLEGCARCGLGFYDCECDGPHPLPAECSLSALPVVEDAADHREEERTARAESGVDQEKSEAGTGAQGGKS